MDFDDKKMIDAGTDHFLSAEAESFLRGEEVDPLATGMHRIRYKTEPPLLQLLLKTEPDNEDHGESKEIKAEVSDKASYKAIITQDTIKDEPQDPSVEENKPEGTNILRCEFYLDTIVKHDEAILPDPLCHYSRVDTPRYRSPGDPPVAEGEGMAEKVEPASPRAVPLTAQMSGTVHEHDEGLETKNNGNVSIPIQENETNPSISKESVESRLPNTIISGREIEACKLLKCNLCGKKFDRKCKLNLHNESKCGSLKLFACNVCSKGYTSKFQLNSHIKIIHNNERRTCKCNFCNKCFQNKKSLVYHRKMHTNDYVGPIPQTCQLCKKVYSSKKTLEVHLKCQHSGERFFECGHCSSKFFDKKQLTVHIHNKHMAGLFKCKKCLSTFCTKKILKEHLVSEHSTLQQEPPHVICEVCGKQCTNKCNFKVHLLTHTNEKPHVCETCGKCFRTESNLDQHSVIHSDLRPYTCDLCGNSFKIRNHLRQHMSVHGMENTSVKRKRTFKRTRDSRDYS